VKNKINVAIIGVGNCAKSLIEGISYYKDDMSDDINGLMLTNIGGYRAGDIEFKAAWDIDYRKVGLTLYKAINSKPNNAITLKENASDVCFNTIVRQGPLFDGIGSMMLNDQDKDNSHVPIRNSKSDTKDDIINELKNQNIDVILNYLPVGSQKATEFWMECALEAKVHVVNCIPIFIASDLKWEQRFIDAGLTIIGDDMRSQAGASIISAILQEMFFTRGHEVTMHYQDNIGGNCDFKNMQDPKRLISKKISKENVIRSQNILHEKEILSNTIHAGPAQYFSILKDNKRAHWLIKATGFCNSPVEFTADLSVQDSPNSAGVVIDAIRLCKVASELDIVGAIHGASAATQKSPPVDMSTTLAKEECISLANRKLTNFTKYQLKDLNPNAKKLFKYFNKIVMNFHERAIK